MAGNESGLADEGLKWMIDQLTEAGVLFSAVKPYPIAPSHLGVAHKPWVHSPWNYPGVKIGPRQLPPDMERHPSIALRMAAAGVVSEPGEDETRYDPPSLRLIDAPTETRKAASA
jgi:hypothetical protein